MTKIAFFDTKPYDREQFERVAETRDWTVRYFETRLTPDTVDLARGCKIAVVFVNDDLSAPVLKQLQTLGVELIALRCAGFNNLDRDALGTLHAVRVPAYSPYAIAEHTMGMILTSIRRIHKAYNRTKEFNYSLNGLTGFDLHEKTVGIIGMGRIGTVFAEICRGFGMKILAYDPKPKQGEEISFVSLEQLFRESDIISLHCPLTPETEHIIDQTAIQAMKPGVILVNTSRGALIDAEALLEGIKARRVGGACLDVYEEESEVFFEDRSGHILSDDTLARLTTMPNVLITAHQAFLTKEALENIAATTAENIDAFLAGKELKNAVLPTKKDAHDIKYLKKPANTKIL